MQDYYICKQKIHSKNVGEYLDDDLYKFTEAHLKSGARKAAKYIPQKDRGFDKQTGTRRSMYYAKPLHVHLFSYLIRKEKTEKRAERFGRKEHQLAMV